MALVGARLDRWSDWSSLAGGRRWGLLIRGCWSKMNPETCERPQEAKVLDGRSVTAEDWQNDV